MMTSDEFGKVAQACKENGVTLLKLTPDSCEIQFQKGKEIRPDDFPRIDLKSPRERALDALTNDEFERMPSEDEMLLRSTPAFDEVRAERAAAAQSEDAMKPE